MAKPSVTHPAPPARALKPRRAPLLKPASFEGDKEVAAATLSIPAPTYCAAAGPTPLAVRYSDPFSACTRDIRLSVQEFVRPPIRLELVGQATGIALAEHVMSVQECRAVRDWVACSD